jgi:hypothetical protein
MLQISASSTPARVAQVFFSRRGAAARTGPTMPMHACDHGSDRRQVGKVPGRDRDRPVGRADTASIRKPATRRRGAALLVNDGDSA